VKRSPAAREGFPRGLVAVAAAVALIASITVLAGSAGATRNLASGRISARLNEKVFTSNQAVSIKLIYRFSKPSRSFAYRLDFKLGKKWQPVRSAKSTKKRGYFKGPKTVTVKKLFAGKAIKLGRYRLKLSADKGNQLLVFKVVKATVVVSRLSAGSAHTCAVFSAGTVKCWGENSNGQLGYGSTATRSTAVQVKGITDAVSVDAGTDYTCAVLSTGAIVCWGLNDSGQLGDGVTNHGSMNYPFGLDLSPVPVAVKGISNATQVSAGVSWTCALLADGTVKCWGGSNGRSPTRISGISHVAQISVGDGYACALLISGEVKCWGANRDGQLGDGSTKSRTTPVRVIGIRNAIQVSANVSTPGRGPNVLVLGIPLGGSHVCALLADGSVRCWGFNGNGEMGLRRPMSRPSPVKIAGIANATQVTAGDYHTCAVISGGTIRCCGSNYHGQLGSGPSGLDAISRTPVRVAGISNAVSASAGFGHTCAGLAGGAIRCWGRNSEGEVSGTP